MDVQDGKADKAPVAPDGAADGGLDDAPEVNPPAEADAGSDRPEDKSVNLWLWVGISFLVVAVVFFCLAAWKPDTFSPQCSRDFFKGLCNGDEPAKELEEHPAEEGQKHATKYTNLQRLRGAARKSYGGSDRNDVTDACVNHKSKVPTIRLKNFQPFELDIPVIGSSKTGLSLHLGPSSFSHWDYSNKDILQSSGITKKQKRGYVIRIGEDWATKFEFKSPFDKLNGLHHIELQTVMYGYFKVGLHPEFCGCQSCAEIVIQGET